MSSASYPSYVRSKRDRVSEMIIKTLHVLLLLERK